MEKPDKATFIKKQDLSPSKRKIKTYKAKHGDTRVTVAARFDISIETLTRLNPQIEYWGDIEGKTLNVLP